MLVKFIDVGIQLSIHIGSGIDSLLLQKRLNDEEVLLCTSFGIDKLCFGLGE